MVSGESVIAVAMTEPGTGSDLQSIRTTAVRDGDEYVILSFADMRVPAENLLGGVEGNGFAQLLEQLPRERLTIGIDSFANAEAAMLETIRYAKERTAFGEPILDFQKIYGGTDEIMKILIARSL